MAPEARNLNEVLSVFPTSLDKAIKEKIVIETAFGIRKDRWDIEFKYRPQFPGLKFTNFSLLSISILGKICLGSRLFVQAAKSERILFVMCVSSSVSLQRHCLVPVFKRKLFHQMSSSQLTVIYVMYTLMYNVITTHCNMGWDAKQIHGMCNHIISLFFLWTLLRYDQFGYLLY